MPNIKSAKKRVKIAEKKNLRNRMVKSALKTELRKFEQALASNDAARAGTELQNAMSALDRAASKGVIHKNSADRRKAQLSRRVNALAQ